MSVLPIRYQWIHHVIHFFPKEWKGNFCFGKHKENKNENLQCINEYIETPPSLITPNRKVRNSYLPTCHSFLPILFKSIQSWQDFVQFFGKLSDIYSPQSALKKKTIGYFPCFDASSSLWCLKWFRNWPRSSGEACRCSVSVLLFPSVWVLVLWFLFHPWWGLSAFEADQMMQTLYFEAQACLVPYSAGLLWTFIPHLWLMFDKSCLNKLFFFKKEGGG